MPYKPKIHKPYPNKTNDRVYDKVRDQTPERKFIHSDRWRKNREKKLTQDPFCEICLKKGNETLANTVHHIDENELNNLEKNYMSVCEACHNRLHKGNYEKKTKMYQ